MHKFSYMFHAQIYATNGKDILRDYIYNYLIRNFMSWYMESIFWASFNIKLEIIHLGICIYLLESFIRAIKSLSQCISYFIHYRLRHFHTTLDNLDESQREHRLYNILFRWASAAAISGGGRMYLNSGGMSGNSNALNN